MYYEKDVNADILKDKTVAVIGYGIQGRAQALNLKDSGVNVVVSDLEGSLPWKNAEEDGFKPVSAAEASKQADIIQILTQDHVQADVYNAAIRDNLSGGKVLLFSHGFNIHFGQIVPPDNVDVIMVAPKGPGSIVRDTFKGGGGVPCLIAVWQDFSGRAKDIALGYAHALGGTRAGVIETTFAEETETDLFGEQAVLCGGVSELIRAAFDTLVEAGYQPEIAYFECLHELKLITDMIYRHGIEGMRARVSDTAEYGDLTRGGRVITEETREEMREILCEIQSGEFAREWILENKVGRPVFKALRRGFSGELVEEVGKKLRKMMKWLG